MTTVAVSEGTAQLARAAKHVKIELSIALLTLVVGEEKIEEAFAAADRTVRPDDEIAFVGGYLRPAVVGALGDLINRRTVEGIVFEGSGI